MNTGIVSAHFVSDEDNLKQLIPQSSIITDFIISRLFDRINSDSTKRVYGHGAPAIPFTQALYT